MKKSIGTLIAEVTLLIGILFLVVLGILFLSRKPETNPVQGVSQKQPTEAAKPAPVVFDADGDELPDWEEALWGTDPKKPDTDSDGTPDGAEVAAHRNPRKVGPNDSLETPLSVLASPQEKKTAPPETFAPTTPPRGLAAYDYSTTPPQAGGGKDPTLVSDSPKTREEENPLHTFGNAIGTPIQKAAVDSDAELAFWNSAAGNTKMTESLLQGFGKLAKKYDQIALDIAAVVPPEKASPVHSAIVRAYQNYARSIQTISGTKAGAYLSGTALTEYSESALALAKAFVAVSDFLYSEGVSFSQTEPGSIFSFPR
ncbi:MAG: hypothetical protein Q7R64_02585 [bacterium]|nr:hypothetical protein [bacterium]